MALVIEQKNGLLAETKVIYIGLLIYSTLLFREGTTKGGLIKNFS